MALIECTECKAEISDSAEACPKCGAPVKKEEEISTAQKVFGGGCLLLIVIIVIAIVVNIGDDEDSANQQETLEDTRPSIFPAEAVACISEETLDQLQTATFIDKDDNAINYLFNNNQCFIAKQNFEMTYIDRGWVTSHIRIYTENGALELWTSEEKLREYFEQQNPKSE